MAWERRRNRTYYYRARKIDGRVVKEYVGAGPLAEVAAARDALAREGRRDAREQRDRERRTLLAVDAPAETYSMTLETLIRAGLLLAGYHRLHGGEWRQRRDG
jgi:hypothetical protein